MKSNFQFIVVFDDPETDVEYRAFFKTRYQAQCYLDSIGEPGQVLAR